MFVHKLCILDLQIKKVPETGRLWDLILKISKITHHLTVQNKSLKPKKSGQVPVMTFNFYFLGIKIFFPPCEGLKALQSLHMPMYCLRPHIVHLKGHGQG